jgi:hypothetical protein
MHAPTDPYAAAAQLMKRRQIADVFAGPSGRARVPEARHCRQIENGNIRGFIRQWRARRDSNS